MKIANWNIERLKHSKRLDLIKSAIQSQSADILILTESDTRVMTGYPYESFSGSLETDYYKKTERRITIHSVYPIIGHEQTFNDRTSICPIVATPKGNLRVYGTIIGIHGNRRPSFKRDLVDQLEDIERISAQNTCVVEDFNISFSDNYYYTKFGRDALNQCFVKNQVLNGTAALKEAIDHICISREFIGHCDLLTDEWNLDKSLSDHKGVSIEFE